jgi:signal transduction histidine kinase
MRTALPIALRAVMLLLLLSSSAAVLYVTYRNARNSDTLAVSSLESTALGLSSSAERSLRASGKGSAGEIREILSDRVVAYALIAKRDGTILFHTNPRMAGSRLSDTGLRNWLRSGVGYGRRVTLGTGLPAFEYNYILHRPDGTPELLRIVLHTAAADRITSDARKMWWTVAGVLALLWAAGILLERLFTRQLRLAAEVERRERLSLIGQMTASLAHEIRNALGSIKGFAQLAEEKKEKPDAGNGAVPALLRGVARIETLVDDLLLFAREEEYDTSLVEIEPLVREAMEVDAPRWGGAVELSIPPGIRARADRDKLSRVLSNGIRNAVQSMGDTGTLRISAEEVQGRVAIRIEDAGPGIPEAARSRLFTPFHTTKTDGTGLGLAYSKKVVEGMGGRIDLSNREYGKGAVLSIRLPAGEKSAHA